MRGGRESKCSPSPSICLALYQQGRHQIQSLDLEPPQPRARINPFGYFTDLPQLMN